MSIGPPRLYTTEEGGKWLTFPLNLFPDFDYGNLMDVRDGSHILLLSELFPGLSLRVFSLRWKNGETWDTRNGWR